MYVHVWTMYVHASDNASVCTLLRHVYTNHEMYIHVYTWYVQNWKIINMYIHGMYMVCTMRATNMYVNCSDMYVHVYTFTYKFCIIQTCHCTYKIQTCQCIYMFMQAMFSVQMATYISWIVQTAMYRVHTSFNCVRTLIYPFGCSFFIRPAGWPVGWDWLLPGVTPIQVQAH